MNLNNQIFSLRQAIIKAKRKAKQESSSSDEDRCQSSSQQQIDQKLQTKRAFSMKNINSTQSLEKSVENSVINSISKDLYSSKKIKIAQDRKNDQVNESQVRNMQQSFNRTPLTYSKTFNHLQEQESRVSKFSINSEVSKSEIYEKMKKRVDRSPQKQKSQPKQMISSQKKTKSIKGFQQSVSKVIQNQENSPQYNLTMKQLGISTLFQKIMRKSPRNKKKTKYSNNQNDCILDMIAEWKQVKRNLKVKNYV